MKLTDRIHLLKIDFEIPISPEKKISRFVNVILIFSDKITLIDTGVKGSEKFIFEYIKNQNRNYHEIESIILSHSHPDHIGSAAVIKSLTNCRVYADELEKEWIENIEIQNKERPVPGFFNLVDKSVSIDEFLLDNQEILIQEGLTLKIIKSPGHSSGSINVLFKEDRILFTADSIPLKNDIPNYDNYWNLIKSLNSIKNNQNYDVLLTSWTPPLFDPKEIKRILNEGAEYVQKIDHKVKDYYKQSNNESLENCRLVIEKLGLPSFFANPMSDKAFKSHLEKNSTKV
jgi:glyoxylase-like metal-dependent hydrolase (beta-lactamase superfamily II)